MEMKGNVKTHLEKILSTIRILLNISAFVLVVFHYLRVINNGLHYAITLLGISICISAFKKWNEDRDGASLYIILAILIFMVMIPMWLN